MGFMAIIVMFSILPTAVSNIVYTRQPIVLRPSTNLLTAVDSIQTLNFIERRLSSHPTININLKKRAM